MECHTNKGGSLLEKSNQTSRIKVGLIGYGKTGQAVAKALSEAEDVALQWICRRDAEPGQTGINYTPIYSIYQGSDHAKYLQKASVDCIIVKRWVCMGRSRQIRASALSLRTRHIHLSKRGLRSHWG